MVGGDSTRGRASRGLRRRAAAAAVLALVAIGVTAAPGAATRAHAAAAASNGVASQSPDAIFKDARNAVEGASTVHIAGSGFESGSKIALNLSLAKGEGGRGSVTLAGAKFRFIVIGKTLYFKASAAFWKKLGGSEGATVSKLIGGRWLETPTTGQFSGVSAFSSAHSIFSGLVPSGKLATGAPTTVAGQQVVPVIDKSNGAILYVATTGRPYPIEIVGARSDGGGVVRFDDFNKLVTLTAPPNAINISKLTGSG